MMRRGEIQIESAEDSDVYGENSENRDPEWLRITDIEEWK